MDKMKRQVLDSVISKFLAELLSEFEKDDRDLFLDAVMQWLRKEFGYGEILEYVSIGLSARSTDSQEVKNDLNRVVELIHKAMEAIPPEEFNLFDEKEVT